MAHQHNHTHSHAGNNIRIAFLLNLGFTLFEAIGGLYVNSVAILSDALHDLGDSFSLGISWYLQKKSGQQSNARFSYGYRRYSLLGALINSLVLIAGSVFVITEAIQRILVPEPSNAAGMIVFAIIGVAVNGYAAWKLSKGKSLNERVVSWHLVEDVLGWIAVLIVAIVLLFTDINYLDPALSLLITLYILWNVVMRLRETLMIFLQAVPSGINIEAIKDRILQLPHVHSLHHTHVWSLEGEHHVFTTHIKLQNIDALEQIIAVKDQVKAILQDYHFEHHTIETELDKETCPLADSY
jgi:cation diffusion facilitator family transporter